jgi:hypothetical protein
VSDSRKATDVLLSVEQKLETLIELLRVKDLNDKILSNKLNSLMNVLSQEKQNTSPVFTAEAVVHNIQSQIPIKQVSAEDSLPLESMPSSNGFSRTSRSETFAGDHSYLKKPPKKETAPRMPIQVPKGGHVEIVVPQQAIDLNKPSTPLETKEAQPYQVRQGGVVSVVQRVTDKNGKSLFLADVEVINKEDLQVVQKLKTNATGKWMCSLPVGEYSVVIKKRDPITKQIVEVGQNIQVTGLANPLELPMAIIKG